MSFKSFMTELMNDKKKCVLVISIVMAIIVAVCVIIAVLLSESSKTMQPFDHNSSNSSGISNQTGSDDEEIDAVDSASEDSASTVPSSETGGNANSSAVFSKTDSASGTNSQGTGNTSSGNKQYAGEIVFREPETGTSDLNTKTIQIKASMPGFAIPEACPSILFVNGKSYLTVPTGHSVTIPLNASAKPIDIFKSLFCLDSNNAWLSCDNMAQTGLRIMGKGGVTTEEFNKDDCWKPGYPYWKRSYYSSFGITTAKIDGTEYVFSINHGENKNEKFQDGRKYMNTIQAKRVYADNEYSGPRQTANGLVYDDYAPSYFAFTGLSVVPANEFKQGVMLNDDKYDKGPIVWPTNGYIDINGNRTNSGLRHPSIFVDNGYIYVYYLDNDRIRVARAPLSSKGEPGSFKAYANGNWETDALPSGFDKNSRSFFRKGIGETTAILKGSRSLRFSVAKLKGTPYYIGVEEYFTSWPAAGCQFRLSKDLVNWSEPFKIPGSYVTNYNTGTLHYPVFYNKDFTSNTEIDPEEFYLMGTSGNNVGAPQTDAVKFSIEIN